MYTVYGHVNHAGFISFENTVKRYKSQFTCSGSRAILDLNFWKTWSSLDSCFAMDSSSSSGILPGGETNTIIVEYGDNPHHLAIQMYGEPSWHN